MTYTLAEIDLIANKIIELTSVSPIICLEGEMGAGKTTLVEAISRNLGIKANTVSSPTFSIINEYPYQNKSLVHMDLYRLKTASELMNIGFEDYIFSSNICIIEWHQIAENLLPDTYILAKIEKIDETTRKIDIKKCH